MPSSGTEATVNAAMSLHHSPMLKGAENAEYAATPPVRLGHARRREDKVFGDMAACILRRMCPPHMEMPRKRKRAPRTQKRASN